METKPIPPAAKPDPILRCVVLIAGTQIGEVKKGKNAKVSLPQSQAKALKDEGLVRIVGV